MGVSLQPLLSLFLLCVHDRNVLAVVDSQDLGGDSWSAVGSTPLSAVMTLIPKATVPGCVHTDWYRNLEPTKENNLYYRYNDIRWRSLAESNWSYRRTFTPSGDILTHKEQWLVCEGLDTIANISVNGKMVGRTKNMFLKHFFNVSGLLQSQFNQITVSFESAVRKTNDTKKTLPYPIPPECVPDVQHGFCQVNLIRKEQCSFSWDWGPGFATQGIWKPIYLLAFDDVVMSDLMVSYDWDANILYVETKYHTAGAKMEYDGTLDLVIDELNITSSYKMKIKPNSASSTITQKIAQKSFKYWWPNGQGDQKLYSITVKFTSDLGKDVAAKTVRFGFRKVELVQQPINGSDGLSFYFKINDRPIFAKGSNWIPADAFKNRLSRENYTNLLQSAKDANMNMLRVWGGGIYERDDFYEIADEMGIMIWHDFMFACAMYPADPDFLESVSKEVSETLWRLQSHPSIVLWAGSNENEVALSMNWYGTKANFSLYKKDYVSLYVNTIKNIVTRVDTTRPFLTSSPTNGVETETEGWVAKNPYDTHYGDTHYYNYNDDCLDWTTYPKTRFASEYGFQSWPSLETLEPVTLAEDLSWDSNFSTYRNHHADGNKQILNQVSMHFNLPNSTVELEKFANQVYLSQIMQALCYKSETEFYRRSRSEIVKGEGHTMGALYWQLNDIWQAPTWSSIEYGGKWKVVHYFAKNFFSNIALSAYDDDTQLTIYSMSDANTPIEPVTLMIEMRQWGSFGTVSTWSQPIYIPPQASKLQFQNSTGTMLHYGGCEYKELCYFVIYLKELPEVEPTYFYPVPFKNIDGLKTAKIEIESVRRNSASYGELSNEFSILLVTSAPAFFVWLEATGIRGRFSDNAFMFYTPNKTISFFAWDSQITTDELKSSIKIRSLADTIVSKVQRKDSPPSRKPSKKEPKLQYTFYEFIESEDEEVNVVQQLYWLDGMQAQLAFGICGILFIMFFAILLVCVVVRFNSPHLDKPKAIPGSTRRNSRKGSVTATRSLFLADQEELMKGMEEENETGAFMLKLKNGYGHNAKNVEIRFYVD